MLFTAQNITAGYGSRDIVSDISFSLEKGQIMGIIGANGSGKTTLLKALCGILPHSGKCTLDGVTLESVPPRRIARLCGYIPQRSGISIDISLMDVVLMGFNPQLSLLEHPNKAMKDRACAMLELVGLSNMAETNYLHLSEGQKQLCILARALVSDTPLLLLDEPESALDFRYRYRMLDMLCQWAKEGQRGAIVTLHDPSLALNYCDRLLLLDGSKVIGNISPKSDDLAHTEALLSSIYGNVSLQYCTGKNNRKHIVMLREE